MVEPLTAGKPPIPYQNIHGSGRKKPKAVRNPEAVGHIFIAPPPPPPTSPTTTDNDDDAMPNVPQSIIPNNPVPNTTQGDTPAQGNNTAGNTLPPNT